MLDVAVRLEDLLIPSGNETPWIHDAIRPGAEFAERVDCRGAESARGAAAGLNLDVRLVSYRAASSELVRLAGEFLRRVRSGIS